MYEDESIICTPKRNALTEVTNSSSYVSPTANLKLLTNVALQYPTPPPSAAQRKEKSLQILCDRFLSLYPMQGNVPEEIQLDITASRLGVEKRRMYDIINILEAMQCAIHKRKNTYLWYGASRLNSFLRMLKKQGDHLQLSEALRGRAPKPPPPKHKTLGVLAQRFLMLFLVEPPNTLINLEMAVSVLIDASNKNNVSMTPEQLERQHKSKVRRLYDIANVFISIGLIEKVSGNLILKKPVFRYIGPIKLKKHKLELLTPSPVPSPLTPLPSTSRAKACQVFSGRSKRKLEFSTPISRKPRPPPRTPALPPRAPASPPRAPASPPWSPAATAHKWDEILIVADMELTRINNGE